MQFDIQLMYLPHDVPPEMGGTLLVPGSHFRRINESDIARYQNLRGQVSFVGEAGTLLATHHGLWHCGRQNRTDRVRTMLKVRLNPREKQARLWNTDDLDAWEHRPLFSWMGQEGEDVISILATPEHWFELATGRLEIVNRIPALALPDRRRQVRHRLLADATRECARVRSSLAAGFRMR